MEEPKSKKLKVENEFDNPFVYEEGLTDIILKVGDLEIHANKGVLMTCSKVFRDMNLLSTNDGKPITIIDDDPKSFLRFMSFIYPSLLKEPDSVDCLNDILRLGDKYAICETFREKCDTWLNEYFRTNCSKMEEKDRLTCMETADRYDLKKSMATGLKIWEVYDCSNIDKSQLRDKTKIVICFNRLLQFEKYINGECPLCCYTTLTRCSCRMNQFRKKFNDRNNDVLKELKELK